MILRLLFLLPLALSAQTNDVPAGVRLTPPANVPATVLDRFRAEFPKASPTWELHGEQNWIAFFSDDSTQLPGANVYTQRGELIESRRQLGKGSYPAAIDLHFHSRRPTDNYVVWRHDRAQTGTRYMAVTPLDTSWFDAAGNFKHLVRNIEKKDEEVKTIVTELWALNQVRLSILHTAEKNGFVTNTRQIQAEQMDAALRSIADSKNLTLAHTPDEKETRRLEELKEQHGEQLARSVNRELRKNAADISSGLGRAERSHDPQLKELAKKFGGPR